MLLSKKKIIVTGGAGFIGSHVVDLLISKGNEVIIIDDFSTGKWENINHHLNNGQLQVKEADVQGLEKMISLTEGAEIVFHFAVACLRTSLGEPLAVHEINATATLNMCRASLENKVERFVYISSSEVYGSALYTPMDEEHPVNPTTVYGASKAAGELYTMAYWRTYGLPTITVRPFNTFGPREPSEGHRAEVIPKFVLRGMAGLQPVIFGSGKQTRDFTWVEDTARGIIKAAECDELIGDVVNIACGREVSIERICHLVIDSLGARELKPSYLLAGRPGDVERHYADIGKARKLLGYSPTVDIEDGIKKYIEWIKTESVDIDAWVRQEQIRNW